MFLVVSPAGAQPVPIGVSLPGAPPPADNPCLDAFRRALEELGYGLILPQSILARTDRVIE